MCVFCAAIPSALAIGAAVHGKQREAARRAEIEARLSPNAPVRNATEAEPNAPSASDAHARPTAKAPVAKVTAAAVVMLVIASAVYHTQQPV
jgi:hypothetical protein